MMTPHRTPGERALLNERREAAAAALAPYSDDPWKRGDLGRALRGEPFDGSIIHREPLRTLLATPGVVVQELGWTDEDSWTCLLVRQIVALPVQLAPDLRHLVGVCCLSGSPLNGFEREW